MSSWPSSSASEGGEPCAMPATPKKVATIAIATTETATRRRRAVPFIPPPVLFRGLRSSVYRPWAGPNFTQRERIKQLGKLHQTGRSCRVGGGSVVTARAAAVVAAAVVAAAVVTAAVVATVLTGLVAAA